MVYIFETDLVNEKSIFFSLQLIYGIGKSKSDLLCRQMGFSKNLKTYELSKIQIFELVKLIEKSKICINNDL